VERFRPDVLSIYSDEYYFAAAPEVGYVNYEEVAEQGVLWAGALASLLTPGGVLLDIGCADGRALKGLGPAYTKLGIEVNPEMAARTAGSGIRIIANDLMHPRLVRHHAATVDLALSIAVFEHIPDFREAFEAAVQLLKPDGLLVFEVPLIRSSGDVWFRSSLEHLHYPTEESLSYLFDQVLHLPLWGMPAEARDFGWVYVGVTSNSKEVLDALRVRLDHLFKGKSTSLTSRERRFRCLFDLIHLSNSNPETVALLQSLEPADLSPQLLDRLAIVWAASETRWSYVSEQLEEARKARDWRDEIIRDREEQLLRLQTYVVEAEKARDWHAAETLKRDEIIRDREEQCSRLRSYLVEVEKARDWHAAETLKRGEIIGDREEQLMRLQSYLLEAEKARDWHAAETLKRDEIIRDREEQLMRLQSYLLEVEKARDWHAAEAAKRDRMISDGGRIP
jgi:SAM-dependent methyltransferase